jgi:threonylcarbamoyladenosine tRNA methylthiotransferase MtaB
MLHILSEKKKRAFYESMIDSEAQVLIESEEEQGNLLGFTENYVKVKIPFNTNLINSIQRVKLTAIDRDGLMLCELLDL